MAEFTFDAKNGADNIEVIPFMYWMATGPDYKNISG